MEEKFVCKSEAEIRNWIINCEEDELLTIAEYHKGQYFTKVELQIIQNQTVFGYSFGSEERPLEDCQNDYLLNMKLSESELYSFCKDLAETFIKEYEPKFKDEKRIYYHVRTVAVFFFNAGKYCLPVESMKAKLIEVKALENKPEHTKYRIAEGDTAIEIFEDWFDTIHDVKDFVTFTNKHNPAHAENATDARAKMNTVLNYLIDKVTEDYRYDDEIINQITDISNLPDSDEKQAAVKEIMQNSEFTEKLNDLYQTAVKETQDYPYHFWLFTMSDEEKEKMEQEIDSFIASAVI